MKLVCIPAYNEGKMIKNLVQKCLQYSDKVIVCDDGSIDNTSKLAEEGGATVISHKKNQGKGSALKTLFKHAKELGPEVMITIDGDNQFLPEEINKLAEPILKKKADIVIGYRFDENSEMPSYRKIGNKVLDKVTKMASDLPFRDTQSGFRSYSNKALELLDFKSSGFGADSEILIDASQKRLKILEEKVSVIYNTGESTSTKNPISHSADVFSSLLELIAFHHPLKMLGIPGIILLIVGVVFSVIVIAMFNETRYFSIPTTLVAFGSLTIGLLLLMMSVILYAIGKKPKNNSSQ